MPDFLTWMWCMMGPMMLLGLMIFIGIIAAIAIVIVWSVRLIGQPSQAIETPLAILERRYARGEITREQFEELKRQISEE